YAKRGDLDLAQNVFDQMPRKNVVSWTILISGYSQRGMFSRCFDLLSKMLLHRFKPNDFAYASVLSVCDHFAGRQVHGLALKTGFDSWIYVANALISMYWKSSGAEAFKVFDSIHHPNAVTYNSMISGSAMCGEDNKPMILFRRMCREGIRFDRTTLLSSISGGIDDSHICCSQLHSLSIRSGLETDAGVATALIKAYSVAGEEIEHCHKIFSEISSENRDIVVWTGIISACSEKDPDRALLHFNQMRRENLNPDSYVFLMMIKACSNLVTVKNASALHSLVISSGFQSVTQLGSVLIHAYARSGSLACAQKVFDEIPNRDLVSWNSILKAYAVHGKADAAMNLFFTQMNVAPDETTFTALLTSCSHAGLIDDGAELFDAMYQKYGIAPQLDHYACMVDIFGRAGHLPEAENIIRQMPMEPDYVIWSALLGACRKHGHTKLAELASSKLKLLNPRNSLSYVQISNLYCSSNSFNEGSSVRGRMIRSGIRKEPGLSWTEVKNTVHEFASGGRRHPELKTIVGNLEKLLTELKKVGYVPETGSVLFDVEEEHKEEQLNLHSEKLALVFSLMNNNNSSPAVKITKNIRICSDCHNFMKFASRIVEDKAIIVRDSNRFHRFEKGTCSCNDYW
ncbi:hypothetical protein M569_01463, partial [Genlisea aurea]